MPTKRWCGPAPVRQEATTARSLAASLVEWPRRGRQRGRELVVARARCARRSYDRVRPTVGMRGLIWEWRRAVYFFSANVTCVPTPHLRCVLASKVRLSRSLPSALGGHAVPSVVALPLVVRRRPYWHCAIVPCSSPAPTPVADSPCRNTLKSEHAHGRWMYPWRSSSRGTSSTSLWATCPTNRSIPTSPPRRAMRGWA